MSEPVRFMLYMLLQGRPGGGERWAGQMWQLGLLGKLGMRWSNKCFSIAGKKEAEAAGRKNVNRSRCVKWSSQRDGEKKQWCHLEYGQGGC